MREWAATKYPGVFLQEQVRLGPTHAHVVGVPITPALASMLRVLNWYCDGLLALPDQVLIIESKMQPTPEAVGQVLFYRELAIGTPALSNLLALPWYPVVLFSEEDDGVTKWARKMGCRVETYTPPWIASYLEKVQFRNRSGSTSSTSDDQG